MKKNLRRRTLVLFPVPFPTRVIVDIGLALARHN